MPLASRVCVSPNTPLQWPVTGIGSSNGGPESWVRFAPSEKEGVVKDRSGRKRQRVQRQPVHPSGTLMAAGIPVRLLMVTGVSAGDYPPTFVLVDDGGDPAWGRASVAGLLGFDDGLRGRCLLLLGPACAPLSALVCVSVAGGLSEAPASLTLLGWRTPPLPRVRRRPAPELCRLRPTGPRSAGCTW